MSMFFSLPAAPFLSLRFLGSTLLRDCRIMLFVRAAALSSFVVLASSKPFAASNVVPRQEGASTPDPTICGDIVVNARNGK
jgi:hypothetical protein